MLKRTLVVGGLLALTGLAQPARAQGSFVNWENAHVHPLEITADGTRLLAVNTPDNRLEVFDITVFPPDPLASIPVGLDPVSVRQDAMGRAWVINHISDSVSIVDLGSLNVVATVETDDEPADVVFVGSHAFVSCSQVNEIEVFDVASLAKVREVALDLEEPRAMAVGSVGNDTFIYVASFESGNRTTILAGGSLLDEVSSPTGEAFPPDVVSDPDPDTPYDGVNPPPNDPSGFVPTPPTMPSECDADEVLPSPSTLEVGLIVRKNASGQWVDDNGEDWTLFVSGNKAAQSGRPVGWDLYDHDLAIIDADDINNLTVTYATGLMNSCMALAVNPATDDVTVVGIDATNEIRFEPILNGRFLRVNVAQVGPGAPTAGSVSDLNPHLLTHYDTDPTFVPIPQPERDKSIGDPRGVAWKSDGSAGYVSGMGSNNVVLLGANGQRVPDTTIEVGEGPTGLALDPQLPRLYVLNKFDASISVIDTNNNSLLTTRSFYDPSPGAIRTGRKHLYDTHGSSGLGHIACASCHVDARIDRLAWDLGNPADCSRVFNQNCMDQNCQDFHPMKGPMTTQTLQDIIGKEPHHWRGDRTGLEEFAGAFNGLMGDDDVRDELGSEMQEFERFLETIHFPPNPFRKVAGTVPDNSLPTALELPMIRAQGDFQLAAGTPLTSANLGRAPNAQQGLQDFLDAGLDPPFQCSRCHTLPVGVGPAAVFDGQMWDPIDPGTERGEFQHGLVSVDGSTNISMKVPHLRNMHEKIGFDMSQTMNLSGFGYTHDGSVPTLPNFFFEPVFAFSSDLQVADVSAFMMAFAGSDLPDGDPSDPQNPPGPASLDSHAAVGIQRTLRDPAGDAFIDDMIELADSDVVGLVVKGVQAAKQRGYAYHVVSTTDPQQNFFRSDREDETFTVPQLQAKAAVGRELTYTIVPKGSETRIGIDRDEDGALDRDELDGCSDPADPGQQPPRCGGGGPICLPVLEAEKESCGFDQLCQNNATFDVFNCLGQSSISSLNASTSIVGAPSQGYPQSYVVQLNNSSPEPATHWITVLNGANGTLRLSGARILINGVVVLAEAEITSGDSWADAAVELQPGNNTLQLDNLTEVTGALTLLVTDTALLP